MAATRTKGGSALKPVLSFTFARWRTRWPLVAGIALAMSCATLTEVAMPVFAGRLVDAIAQGRGSAPAAVQAFVAMVVLGLAMVGLRHLAWWGIVPMTLRLMSELLRDAFHRVQRLSTDWHANSFAGSTVRKITRGCGRSTRWTTCCC